ncbi:MAG: NUDIX hydrolase [Phenylobacterium sp.]|nr:MAG: NUDIX hydrolase [Phenylobacterium sp.]
MRDRDGENPREQFAALPWRRAEDGRVEVLLITSRETRRWIIPKGWGKPDEAPAAAAAREAFEETGVKGVVGDTPLGDYRYDKLLKDGRVQQVTVGVYALETTRERKSWPEKDLREKMWVAPDIAAGLVDEPELQALIAAFAP